MKYIHLQESKERGYKNFPYEFYHLDSSHPQYILKLHWHEELEFIRVISGELHLCLEDTEITLRSNEVALVNISVLHSGIPKDCVYECIVFDIKMLFNKNPEIMKYISPIANKQITLFNHFENDNSLLSNYFKVLFTKDISAVKVVGLLYLIIDEIINNHMYYEKPINYGISSHRLSQLNKVLKYIEENYSNYIKISDLSDILDITPNHFSKIFKDVFKQTVSEYIIEYRIEMATLELSTTHHSVTEVALNNGFSDSSYFIKMFKKIKGCSPKKYINSLQQ